MLAVTASARPGPAGRSSHPTRWRMFAAGAGLLLILLLTSFATASPRKVDRIANGKFAFTVEVVDASGHLSSYSTWSVNPDGSSPRRLGDGHGPVVWSPDGKQIVFQHHSGILYLMKAEGTGIRKLSVCPSFCLSLTWRPRTRDLVGEEGPLPGGLYATDTVTGMRRPFLRGRTDIHWPTWAPDGQRFAYDADDELHVISADGSNDQVVINRGDDGCGRSDAAWSPDGRWIAFSRCEKGLWRVHPDGSALQRLIPNGSGDFAWAPDGTKIAFLDYKTVHIRNLRTHKMTRFLWKKRGEPYGIAWQPLPRP